MAEPSEISDDDDSVTLHYNRVHTFRTFRDWFLANKPRVLPSLLYSAVPTSEEEATFMNFLWHYKINGREVGRNCYCFPSNIQTEADFLGAVLSSGAGLDRYKYKAGSWTPFQYTG